MTSFFKIHDRLPEHPELAGLTTKEFGRLISDLAHRRIPRHLEPVGPFRDRDGSWIALATPNDSRPVALIRPDGWTPSRRKLSPALRLRVFDRDGRVCAYCGSVDELQIDHIYPVSLGGSDDLENLQVLCGPCNRHKSARVED